MDLHEIFVSCNKKDIDLIDEKNMGYSFQSFHGAVLLFSINQMIKLNVFLETLKPEVYKYVLI